MNFRRTDIAYFKDAVSYQTRGLNNMGKKKAQFFFNLRIYEASTVFENKTQNA